MKKRNYYCYLFLLITISLLKFNLAAFAIDEVELKSPSWLKEESKVTLKGNIREDISKVKPLTGIGVIGLRFIHQAGYSSYIEQVYPNSPASKGGLQSKDLIFAIDGVRTDYLNSDSVYEMLSGEPGSKVKLFITRGQSMFNIELVREDLANFPNEVQNRYLSGPIAVPINPKDFLPYH